MRKLLRMTGGELFKLLCCRSAILIFICLLLLSSAVPFLSRAALSASSILEPRIDFQHEYDLLIQELDELKREEMSAFAVQVIDLYQQQLQDLYTVYHEQGLSPNTNLQTADGLRTYTASMVFSYQLSEKIREINQGERPDAELSELLERIPADILYYYPSSLLDEQFQSDMRQLSQMFEQGYDPEQIIREQITSLRQSIESCEREGNEEEVEYLRNKLEQKEYRLSVGGYDPRDWKSTACDQLKVYQAGLIQMEREKNYSAGNSEFFYSDLEAKEQKERSRSIDRMLVEFRKQASNLECAIGRDTPPIEYAGLREGTRRQMVDFLPLLLGIAACASVFGALSMGMERPGTLEGLFCRRTTRTVVVCSKLVSCGIASTGLVAVCTLAASLGFALLFGTGDLGNGCAVYVLGESHMIPFGVWYTVLVLQLLCVVWLCVAAAFFACSITRKMKWGILFGLAAGGCTTAGLILPPLWMEYQSYLGMSFSTEEGTAILPFFLSRVTQVLTKQVQLGFQAFAFLTVALLLAGASLIFLRRKSMYK